MPGTTDTGPSWYSSHRVRERTMRLSIGQRCRYPCDSRRSIAEPVVGDSAPVPAIHGRRDFPLLWPNALDLRLERGFDRPVRRLNGNHAPPSIGDTARLADALDLRTLLREFASA